MTDKIIVTAPDGTKYNIADLLTVDKLMEVFSVTRITVYNWLGKKDKSNMYPSGKFPHAFKVGKIYIPIIDVKRMISNKTVI
jgi:hypothetical protein